MVCLAPEPDKVAREMLRVTKPGGVLGLAVWGDECFGRFYAPWEKACHELLPDYKTSPVMGAEWTFAANVRSRLEGAGFKDVKVWVEELVWRFESAEALAEYFFDANHPGHVKAIGSFTAHGGDVHEARAIYVKAAKEVFNPGDGSVEVPIPATLATARK